MTQSNDVPAIRISRVCKSFGELKVLDDICLEVQHGEVLVICGPSGSGKSTLLRCINCLETVDAGHIDIDGVPEERSRRTLRLIGTKVGMVFQSFRQLGPATSRSGRYRRED